MVYRVTIPVHTLKGIPELEEIITVPRNNHWLGPNGTVLSYLLEGVNDTLINFVFTSVFESSLLSGGVKAYCWHSCDVQMPEGINQRPGNMADVRKRFSEWDPR
jgi:salicylate hydroxylase